MDARDRRYLILTAGIGAAIVNALLNAAAGWSVVRSLPGLGLWSLPGVASDMIATSFGVGFGTALVLPFSVGLDFRRGKIGAPVLSGMLGVIVARLPSGYLRRALWLGVVCMLLFAPPGLLLLSAFAPPLMAANDFILQKALFSAIEGGLVTPIMALAVVADCARKAPSMASAA